MGVKLSKKNLNIEQIKIIKEIIKNKRLALFLHMGFGKTITMLTAISILLKREEIKKVLIISNLAVVNNVWSNEALKWKHTDGLNIKVGSGPLKKVIKAIESEHDIITITKDMVSKVTQYLYRYDFIVFDESSYFKNTNTIRFRSIKDYIKKISRVYIINATAFSENLISLWGQFYLLDGGARLSQHKTKYLNRYFYPVSFGAKYVNYFPKENTISDIVNKIKDITVFSDYHENNNVNIKYENIYFKLPSDAREVYRDIIKMDLDNLKNKSIKIDKIDAASKINKLIQVCNGAIYSSFILKIEMKKITYIHDEKVKILKKIADSTNENILVISKYVFNYKAIKKEFPKAKVYSASCYYKRNDNLIKNWNDGKIKMLISHPKSISHGVNLQYGGATIVWFSLTYDLSEFEQMNARIARKGQVNDVKVIQIIAKGTVEEVIDKKRNDKIVMKDIFYETIVMEKKMGLVSKDG